MDWAQKCQKIEVITASANLIGWVCGCTDDMLMLSVIPNGRIAFYVRRSNVIAYSPIFDSEPKPE